MQVPIMPDEINLGVLHAAPLAWADEHGERHPITQLDLHTDLALLLGGLNEAGRELDIRVEPATTDRLIALLTLGVRAIHYAGHGHPDFLAFEDGTGLVHRVDAAALKDVFSAAQNLPRLAVIAACHSQIAAETLYAAGVPHVIGIRLDQPVFDASAITFTRVLYRALARGSGIGPAFESAVVGVRVMPGVPDPSGEADKFLLLPAYGDHAEVIFPELPDGQARNLSRTALPNNLPAMPEGFVGRSIDTQCVVELLTERRLVTITGAPGIGKTALSIAAGHYLNERHRFGQGVFLVRLRGIPSAEGLRVAIGQALGVAVQDDRALAALVRSSNQLLILDNMEDVLHADPSAVRRLLSDLLQSAPELRILCTSRHAVQGGVEGVGEVIHAVRRLNPEDAALLFLAHAPHAGVASIADLVPHDVLKYLSGHPHAIVLTAPLLQHRTLDELGGLLEQQRIDAMAVADVPEDERDAVTSLVKSLNVSVQQLRERHPEAVRLFAVMGLLPGGAFASDLDEFFGNGWRPLMGVLLDAHLVERPLERVDYYSTFPFVTDFANRLLSADDRAMFERSTLVHFAGLSEALYSQRYAAPGEVGRLFDLEEDNFWACLQRVGGLE